MEEISYFSGRGRLTSGRIEFVNSPLNFSIFIYFAKTIWQAALRKMLSFGEPLRDYIYRLHFCGFTLELGQMDRLDTRLRQLFQTISWK